MQPSTSGGEAVKTTPEHYIWEAEDKPVSIQLRFDVIDRLHPEVMRGFGAVRRRGAEVGGILLGTAQTGERLEVTVLDFEAVPCEYRHGPSYLLSEADRERMREAMERWRPKSGAEKYAVGYYRSHTRPDLALSDEDLALYATFFPEIWQVVLLIRPHATKAGEAGFFFREDGLLHSEAPYLEFPFSRPGLGGGLPPARHWEAGPADGVPAPERVWGPAPEPAEKPRPEEAAPQIADTPTRSARTQRLFPVSQREMGRDPVPSRALGRFAVQSPGPSPIEERGQQRALQPASAATVEAQTLFQGLPAPPPRNKNLSVFPFSFVFLVLGLLLGFQGALQLSAPKPLPPAQDPFNLGLRVNPQGENLQVNWDRQSPAILSAQRATLFIWDGDNQKSTELDSTTLRHGNVIYRRITGTARFRLEVFLIGKGAVSEEAQFRSVEAPARAAGQPLKRP